MSGLRLSPTRFALNGVTLWVTSTSNETVFLANVPREVWRYELGGYPVLKKWLGYRYANRRSNRPLALSELE